MIIKAEQWHPVGITDVENAALNAIRDTRNNLLLHAGPGTGKTEILAQKAAFLFQTGSINASQKILALSYKRNSARDLRERVRMRCGAADAERFESFTFDAFAKILLDRFRELLPDMWRPSANYCIDENLLDPATLRGKIIAALGPLYDEEIENFPLHGFNRSCLTRFPLPPEISFSGNPLQDLGMHMWHYWLTSQPAQLAFPMINALSELLIRLNPELKRILQNTYACVFLDEFQDTTHDQYRLLKTLFHNSRCRLIAAGDEKQNIMLWADALPDGMERFVDDFHANEINLQYNWRSAPQLIEIQNNTARRLLGDQLPEMIPVKNELSGSCRAMIFDSDKYESYFIINEIKNLISSGYSTGDIAVCVRQDSDYCTDTLNRYAEHSGIRFRDEIPIQNLMDEPLTKLLFALWEETFTAGSYRSWDMLNDHLLRSNSSKTLSGFRQSVGNDFPNRTFNKDSFGELIAASMDFLDRNLIRATFEEYMQGSWLDHCLDELIKLADRTELTGKSFPDAIAFLRGDDAIPVLTAHRCKVKEFRALFFVGLEDSSFMDFQLSAMEEECAFFISLSRAQEKLYFTSSRFRSDRPQKIDAIKPLYRILTDSGVNIEEIRQDQN